MAELGFFEERATEGGSESSQEQRWGLLGGAKSPYPSDRGSLDAVGSL